MSAETSGNHDSGLGTALMVCIGLPVALLAMIAFGIRANYEAARKMKCDRTAEWVVCTGERIPTAEIVKVAKVEEGYYDDKTVTVVTKTGTVEVRVADRWFESSMKALVQK